MKKVLKHLLSAFFLIAIFAPVFVFSNQALAIDEADLWGGQQDAVQEAGNFGEEKDPRVLAADIIRILMGFLGIIAVALILWGGFKWMTAGGNDDQAAEGRKWITSGIIGLIIILSAWAIATFVIQQAAEVTQ